MTLTFDEADVIYQEWFASGYSHKNVFTRLGGARNCLRLVVTRQFLFVTSWFPFSIFTPIYDLEHQIPLDSNLSIRESWWFITSSYVVSYRDSRGMDHKLQLLPWKAKAFTESLAAHMETASAHKPHGCHGRRP